MRTPLPFCDKLCLQKYANTHKLEAYFSYLAKGFFYKSEKPKITINVPLFKKLRHIILFCGTKKFVKQWDIGNFMYLSAVVYCCCVLLSVVGCSCVLLCVVAS